MLYTLIVIENDYAKEVITFTVPEGMTVERYIHLNFDMYETRNCVLLDHTLSVSDTPQWGNTDNRRFNAIQLFDIKSNT